MVRYLITAVTALALVSGVAIAEPMDGSKTVTIRNTPTGKVVTKRFVNHRGMLVTKKKRINDGFYGSSVTRSKTVTEPGAGDSVTRRTIIER